MSIAIGLLDTFIGFAVGFFLGANTQSKDLSLGQARQTSGYYGLLWVAMCVAIIARAWLAL